MSRSIRVTVSSVDGYRKSKLFKTLDGAQMFAQKAIGKFPEIGSIYAVDGSFGTTKVEVRGATLEELFPPPPEPTGPEPGFGDEGHYDDDEHVPDPSDEGRYFQAGPDMHDCWHCGRSVMFCCCPGGMR